MGSERCGGGADGAGGGRLGALGCRGRADGAGGGNRSAFGCWRGGWRGNQRDGLGDVGYDAGVLADVGSADTSQVGESSLDFYGVGGP